VWPGTVLASNRLHYWRTFGVTGASGWPLPRAGDVSPHGSPIWSIPAETPLIADENKGRRDFNRRSSARARGDTAIASDSSARSCRYWKTRFAGDQLRGLNPCRYLRSSWGHPFGFGNEFAQTSSVPPECFTALCKASFYRVEKIACGWTRSNGAAAKFSSARQRPIGHRNEVAAKMFEHTWRRTRASATWSRWELDDPTIHSSPQTIPAPFPKVDQTDGAIANRPAIRFDSLRQRTNWRESRPHSS